MPYSTPQDPGAAIEVVSFLSQGGMSEVYLGRHPRAGLVVLKRLIPALEGRPDVPQMFEEEIRVSRLVSGHPNVVRFVGDGLLDGSRFLALELLDGLTLFELVSRVAAGTLVVPLPVVVGLGLGMLEGLGHAHRVKDEAGEPLKLVHRDVSPENVVLTWDGVPKVLDFGVARARGRSAETQPGLLKGKPHYMAPEQLQMLPVDHRVDLFAAAVVLYQLATGKHPFRQQTGRNVMLAILEDAPPPPSSFRKDIPKALDAVLLIALAKAPEARFEDAAAMQEALRDTGIAPSEAEDLAMFASEVRPPRAEGQTTPPELRGRPSWAGEVPADPRTRARLDALARLYRAPPSRARSDDPPPGAPPAPAPSGPPELLWTLAPRVAAEAAPGLRRLLTGVLAVTVLLSLGFRAGVFESKALRVESDPPGAKVWLNDRPQPLLTPLLAPPGEGAVLEVRLEHPGYHPCHVTVTRPEQGADVHCVLAPDTEDAP